MKKTKTAHKEVIHLFPVSRLSSTNIFLTCFLVLTLPFLLGFCSGEAQQDNHSTESHEATAVHNHEGEHAEAENIVHLTPEEMKEFGITTAIAGPAVIHQEIQLTGEISIDSHRMAHIKPRFAGIVTEVHKSIGDPVKKGEILAVIESNESLSKYKLTSAINGTIIDMHMTMGENIADETHIITVADLSVVWANFTIYQKDLPQIKIGQTIFIQASGETQDFSGKIAYISPIVDERTRTATARVNIPNPERLWKPGMFVTGRLWAGETNVPLAVKKHALMIMEDQPVVFVQEDNGFFPHLVTLGKSNGETVEILSGLTPGQSYVVSGALMIKAEMQKNAFGDAHNH